MIGRVVTICVVTAVVVTAAVVVGRLSATGDVLIGPFTGQQSHDFGVIRFDGRKVVLSHGFELRNRTTRPVEVLHAGSSCGCTVADISDWVVAPGHTTVVTVTLNLTQPVLRRETIWLNIKDHGSISLTVSVAARRVSDVYALQSSVDLVSSTAAVVDLIALDYDSDECPPPARFSGPEGVTAAAGPWELVCSTETALGRAARWHARISLSRIGDPPVRGQRLVIDLGQPDAIEVELTGRPWAVAARH